MRRIWAFAVTALLAAGCATALAEPGTPGFFTATTELPDAAITTVTINVDVDQLVGRTAPRQRQLPSHSEPHRLHRRLRDHRRRRHARHHRHARRQRPNHPERPRNRQRPGPSVCLLAARHRRSNMAVPGRRLRPVPSARPRRRVSTPPTPTAPPPSNTSPRQAPKDSAAPQVRKVSKAPQGNPGADGHDGADGAQGPVGPEGTNPRPHLQGDR